jgi:hypothetical protein
VARKSAAPKAGADTWQVTDAQGVALKATPYGPGLALSWAQSHVSRNGTPSVTVELVPAYGPHVQLFHVQRTPSAVETVTLADVD